MKKLPKALNPSTHIYARLDGSCYHLDKNCPLLRNTEFRKISHEDMRRRSLNPCFCAIEGYKPTL